MEDNNSEENTSKTYSIKEEGFKKPVQSPNTYKYQKAMDDLNEMMIRIKVNLLEESELKEMYPKPTSEELEMFTINLMNILQEIEEKQIKS